MPPERLLKARVLMALYGVRSERQFCERLPYDVLTTKSGGYKASLIVRRRTASDGGDISSESGALRPRRPLRDAKPQENRREPRKRLAEPAKRKSASQTTTFFSNLLGLDAAQSHGHQ